MREQRAQQEQPATRASKRAATSALVVHAIKPGDHGRHELAIAATRVIQARGGGHEPPIRLQHALHVLHADARERRAQHAAVLGAHEAVLHVQRLRRVLQPLAHGLQHARLPLAHRAGHGQPVQQLDVKVDAVALGELQARAVRRARERRVDVHAQRAHVHVVGADVEDEVRHHAGQRGLLLPGGGQDAQVVQRRHDVVARLAAAAAAAVVGVGVAGQLRDQ
eukprot:IDg18547t1